MRGPQGKRSVPGPDAKSGTWLPFRLLAAANPTRSGAPAWSVPELVAAARAEELQVTSGAVHAAKSVLLARGLVERAASSGVDVAWRLSHEGRAFAEQHGVGVADEPPGAPTQLLQAPPGRSSKWAWFKLLAAANAGGLAVWHVGELARSASETTGRSYTSQAASWALKALARDGLVERTHNNREAPWRRAVPGLRAAFRVARSAAAARAAALAPIAARSGGDDISRRGRAHWTRRQGFRLRVRSRLICSGAPNNLGLSADGASVQPLHHCGMAAPQPRRLLVVCEAAGAQGGSVVAAALEAGGWAVRALVRDKRGDKARALRERGAEVMRADFRVDDAATLAAAFAGAHAAYFVQNFWDDGRISKDPKQSSRLADAAKASGVDRCIFSLLDESSASQSCAHFRALGLDTTFLVTSLYYEAFVEDGPVAAIAPQKVAGAHGAGPRLRLELPMGRARLPAVALGDIGRMVVALLDDPRSVGRTVGLAGDILTGDEFAAAFTRVLGLPTDYRPPSFDDFRGAPFPNAAGLGSQFEAWHDGEAANCALHDPAQARRYVPDLLTFEDWLLRNKHCFDYLL